MGYYRHKHLLSYALDAITEHGLPVDRARQDALRTYLESEEVRLVSDIQKLVPDAVRPLNRKTPYKSLPKDLRAALKEQELIVPKAKLDYYLVNHLDVAEALGYIVLEDDLLLDSGLYKRLEFNPNSSDQLLEYIRWQMQHGPMDVRWYIPTHIDTGKPTVGKEELNKLITETDDELLKVAQKIKKLTKLIGTYAAGAWIPGPDGRVHGTFRFGTASGQTSCSKPNQQQWPTHYDPDDLWISGIMAQVKECIRAEPGRKFVKLDARGAHAKMQGWLAEDPYYYRLAGLDVHSFNTAHYVNHPLKDHLLNYDDATLSAHLKEIKKTYEYERNYKLKRIAYLMQFGGGAEKAFRILSGFNHVNEVEELMDLVRKLFPKTFIDFPKKVKKMLQASPRIVSPMGACRWFWSGDLEEANAFLPSNCFHCHWQDGLIRLYERGSFEKYQAVNFCHDDLWLHPLEGDVDECIEVCRLEMQKPSDILVNSLGPFQVDVDVQTGFDMNNLVDL